MEGIMLNTARKNLEEYVNMLKELKKNKVLEDK